MKSVSVTWVVVIVVVAAAISAWAGYAGYANQHGCKTTTGADGKKTTACTKQFLGLHRLEYKITPMGVFCIIGVIIDKSFNHLKMETLGKTIASLLVIAVVIIAIVFGVRYYNSHKLNSKFPPNPKEGDKVTIEGTTYIYQGGVWVIFVGNPPPDETSQQRSGIYDFSQIPIIVYGK